MATPGPGGGSSRRAARSVTSTPRVRLETARRPRTPRSRVRPPAPPPAATGTSPRPARTGRRPAAAARPG
ncbi:hypothetical protein DMH15_21305 [Streptomyces sp. WAC 06725]|nr:hypothetical protein DMH15_21305 [Streptomyces sp. WAC 06725]